MSYDEFRLVADELYGASRPATTKNGVSPLGGLARPAAVLAAEAKRAATRRPPPQKTYAERIVSRRLKREREHIQTFWQKYRSG
jgi:hypothetical protein